MNVGQTLFVLVQVAAHLESHPTILRLTKTTYSYPYAQDDDGTLFIKGMHISRYQQHPDAADDELCFQSCDGLGINAAIPHTQLAVGEEWDFEDMEDDGGQIAGSYSYDVLDIVLIG